MSLGFLDDLLMLEEKSGHFVKAADLAKSWGDLSKEAYFFEKAGDFKEVARCLTWYVLFNAAWGNGNTGWPLKQFDQMEEICNKEELDIIRGTLAIAWLNQESCFEKYETLVYNVDKGLKVLSFAFDSSRLEVKHRYLFECVELVVNAEVGNDPDPHDVENHLVT
ncbi:hypothetical protein Tco_1172421 [Tanacetum coccineum]